MNEPSRPAGTSHAVGLLYVTLGMGVLQSVLAPPMIPEGSSAGFVMFIAFAVFGLMWFFIYMIGKGRNWARITFLALFIIGIPFSVLPLVQSLATTPISGILGIGQAVFQATALVFLFQKPSSEWFREVKAGRKSA